MASLPVRDVYRHVIDEVMKSVKNDFYQEGLDDPVIRQVQTLWEVALEETNAVSVPNANAALDTSSTGVPTLEPITGTSAGGGTGGTGGGATSAYTDTYPYQGDLTGALGSSVYGGPTGADGRAGSALAAGLSGRPASSMAPTHVDQSQAYLSSLPNNGGSSNVPQLDGQCDNDNDDADTGVTLELVIDDHTVHDTAHPLPTTSATTFVSNTTRPITSTTTTTSTTTKRQPRFHIPQVDGSQDGGQDGGSKDGGEGMEEEEEFEELGSDDDISDSEEEVSNQDDGPRNRLIAQFDKVNRAKTKWKCTLRDGVIHINGRDHLFFKATGDFIWK